MKYVKLFLVTSVFSAMGTHAATTGIQGAPIPASMNAGTANSDHPTPADQLYTQEAQHEARQYPVAGGIRQANNAMFHGIKNSQLVLNEMVAQGLINHDKALATKADKTELSAEVDARKSGDRLLGARLTTVEGVVADEVMKARAAEKQNAESLVTEVNRAKSAEQSLESRKADKSALSAEVDARRAATEASALRITDNGNRLTTVEGVVAAGKVAQDKVNHDVTRAMQKETDERQSMDHSISASVDKEVARANGAEAALSGRLNGEEMQARAAEKQNAESLVTEVNRAKSAEQSLESRKADKSALSAEHTRAVQSEQRNSQALLTETNRAQYTEQQIASQFSQRVQQIDVDLAETHAAQNRTNQVVARHSEELANHEQRLSDLEHSTSKRFSDMTKRIDSVRKQANAGSASAMAQANIPQVEHGQQVSFGAGVGTYGNQQAVAVGGSFHLFQNTTVKLTASDDTANNFGMGAGFSVGW